MSDIAGTESSLSNWVGPYVTDMLGKTSALADQPYTAYSGQLTAGPSDMQEESWATTGSLWDSREADAFDPTTFTSGALYTDTGLPNTFTQNTLGDRDGYEASTLGTRDPLALNQFDVNDPYSSNLWNWNDPEQGGIGAFGYNPYGETGNFAHDTWTDPANYSEYMSPFMQQALLPQMEEQARQADIQRLQDATRLTQAGAYGGSRQAVMESELNDNLLRLMNETYGTGMQRAYESGQDQFNTEEAAQRQQYNIDREVGLGQNRWENQFLSDRADTELARRMSQFNLEEGTRRDQRNLEDVRDWDRFNTEEARRVGQRNLEEDRYRDQFNLEETANRDQSNIEEDRYRNQFNLEEQNKQQQYNTEMQRLMNQFNQEEQLGFQTNQADRQYGLNLLNNMMQQGDIQRQIESEGIAADISQFENERDYPYRMLQYMQSMLQGLPVGASTREYIQPSGYENFSTSAGAFQELMNNIINTFGGGGEP